MPLNRRAPLSRLSPLTMVRLILWGACLVIIAWLWLRSDRTREESAPSSAPPPTASERPAQPLRFGVMNRTAHLVVLWGLGTELCYAAAVQQSGDQDGLAIEVFESADLLRAAFADRQLDIACVPLRDAVLLQNDLGDAAPIVIAGAARGDEQLVLGRGLTSLPLGDLGGYRVALVEEPRLDLARWLEHAGGPSIVRAAAGEISELLARGDADFAVLPAPLADAAAATSGGRVIAPNGLEGGAVLVADPTFLAAEQEFVGLLLQQHELAARLVASDPGQAAAVAAALVRRAGRSSPPDLFWTKSLEHVRTGTDIPVDALSRLSANDVSRWIDALPQQAARREVAEILDDDGGENE